MSNKSDQIQSELTDILSSGQGLGVMNWHKSKLIKMIDQYGLEEMKKEVKSMYESNFDLEWLKEGEVEMMYELFGIEINLQLEVN